MSLSTGYGKSLCFALLPCIFNMKRKIVGATHTLIVMVVSPLIALMKDQASSFTKRGIPAAYVSGKDATDKDTRRKFIRGEYQLVFISPEALCIDKILALSSIRHTVSRNGKELCMYY